jgi:hypothetical protein
MAKKHLANLGKITRHERRGTPAIQMLCPADYLTSKGCMVIRLTGMQSGDIQKALDLMPKDPERECIFSIILP